MYDFTSYSQLQTHWHMSETAQSIPLAPVVDSSKRTRVSEFGHFGIRPLRPVQSRHSSFVSSSRGSPGRAKDSISLSACHSVPTAPDPDPISQDYDRPTHALWVPDYNCTIRQSSTATAYYFGLEHWMSQPVARRPSPRTHIIAAQADRFPPYSGCRPERSTTRQSSALHHGGSRSSNRVSSFDTSLPWDPKVNSRDKTFGVRMARGRRRQCVTAADNGGRIGQALDDLHLSINQLTTNGTQMVISSYRSYC